MDNRPIGIFDSGLGGLTVLQEIQKLLPSEDLVYFGDTARIPYGTRSEETLVKYCRQDVAFLKSKDVKYIVVACGTASSVLLLREGIVPFPFTGVIVPATRAALSATRNKKVGILGTAATIRSGAYPKCIAGVNSEILVLSKACPLFVPLVENGFFGEKCEVARLVAEEYLSEIKAQECDTVILGCTHFPILSDVISDVLGDTVTLINPAVETAKRVKEQLMELDLCAERKRKGQSEYFVSDSKEDFCQNASLFLGHSVAQEARKIDIETICE